MFEFISETWNPLGGGPCPHQCIYCWSMGKNGLVKRYDMKKYQGSPRLIEKELNRRFKAGDFIFVCDMLDLFAWNVPTRIVREILKKIREFPKTRFLLQTKNPRGYVPFLAFNEIPRNAVLGVTVETNKSYFDTPSGYSNYWMVSRAPSPTYRLEIMEKIAQANIHKIFMSIEPILDFDLDSFICNIKRLKPWGVAVGYDNYHHKLPEPPLEKTLRLIEELERFTKVYRKTLRRAWYE